MDIIDANARILIAFSLTMIAAFLAYIAFFKNSPKPSKTK